ncbi:hypothetical protein A0H76_496 [Hepatospora eriocheir]|uniref:RNA 3'-terminal phosphate cyclase domain-containing protein n=1 Tax=Hepatospora eriocheir TaxID=1081669 RepID=A0A1X0Q8X0_9MICR|nr:hypothetical protein A0H76_496 [Hepatospora eriocheir]
MNNDFLIPILRVLLLIGHAFKDNLNVRIENVITNDLESIDMYQTAFWLLFKNFNIQGYNLQIIRRAFYKNDINEVNGGIINLRIKKHSTEIESKKYESKTVLNKIRAILVSSRLNSEFIKRMTDVVLPSMRQLSKNAKVFSQCCNKLDSGLCPGYECNVYCESREGVFYETLNYNSVKNFYKSINYTPENIANFSFLNMMNSASKQYIFDRKLYFVYLFYMGLSSGLSTFILREIDEDLNELVKVLEKSLGCKIIIKQDRPNYKINIVGIGYLNKSNI